MEFKLRHASTLDEAGRARAVEAEIAGIAFDTNARLLSGASLNSGLKLEGFLAAKSRRSRKLVLHVTNIEFVEGDTDHAPDAQR